jgi:3-methyladenine DNA glycosylase AlkC
VNRLWSHYLGKGVIHPVDDMRATTPPAVPGLLEALAKDFVAHNYDIKHTIRVILNSRTYQTAAEVNATNKLDDRFYSHFYPRPMPGQVLLDAMNQATGTQERFGEFPVETNLSS